MSQRAAGLTVWYEDAFDLGGAFELLHFLQCFETTSATGFGVGAAWVVVDVDLRGETSEILRSRTPDGFYFRPTKPKRAIGLVEQYLEHAVPGRGLWNTLAKLLVQKVDLLYVHARRSAPIGPAGFILFVIVTRREVDHGVYETQNHAVCSPIDDDVDRHVVGVHGYLIGVLPRGGRPLVAQLTSDTREPGISHAGGRGKADVFSLIDRGRCKLGAHVPCNAAM